MSHSMCCFLHRKISPFYSTNPMCYFQDFFLEFKNFKEKFPFLIFLLQQAVVIVFISLNPVIL